MKTYMLLREPIQTESSPENFRNEYGHAQHPQHHKNPILINMAKALLFLIKHGVWTVKNRERLFKNKMNVNLLVQLFSTDAEKASLQKLIDKLFMINEEISREDFSLNFENRKNTSWQLFDSTLAKRAKYHKDVSQGGPNHSISFPTSGTSIRLCVAPQNSRPRILKRT